MLNDKFMEFGAIGAALALGIGIGVKIGHSTAHRLSDDAFDKLIEKKRIRKAELEAKNNLLAEAKS